MEFSVSPELDVRLTKLKSRDKKLASKIAKQLILFQSDHRHPSLRTHKLTGNLGTYWSISIDLHMRMLYIQNENGAYFFDIGTHDEVYGK